MEGERGWERVRDIGEDAGCRESEREVTREGWGSGRLRMEGE